MNVWVAVAHHVEERDGIDPVIVVGATFEAAERALVAVMEEWAKDEKETDCWIPEHPEMLPVNT